MKTEMKVPFLDLSIGHRRLKSELLGVIEPVIERGDFVMGEEVAEFERKMADYCGVKYAVGVNSGTDALILALKVLGIGPGDEVITSANSFIATLMAVSAAGATPVLVDIDETYNINPALIERSITGKTKALLPVHYTGRMADMEAISTIAARHNLPVIEDAAQAAGAVSRGKKAGSPGLMGCFSFFPTKNLAACGDGGIITTDSAELCDKLRLLRNFGRNTRDTFAIRGVNTRLDTIQAAILLAKLKYLDDWNEQRNRVADYYSSRLRQWVRVPENRPYEKQIYHFYMIRTEDAGNTELQAYLWHRGIDTRIHYPLPMHLQEAYRDLGYPSGSFPVVERYARQILTLPIYPELTREQVAYVVECIQNFFTKDNYK